MAFLLSFFSAFWLGILTSVSPCPLASNVAAISYLSRETEHPARMLLTGFLYSLGRVITYVALGVLITGSLLNIPEVAFFLQSRMNQFLGPVLVLTGAILLEWIRLGSLGFVFSEKGVSWIRSLGNLGALILGLLFALSFCPVSAALFFGSLIPLSVKHCSGVVLPLIYGIGTALPVFVFGLLVALSAGVMAKAFHKVSQFELWARRITGVIFLFIGIYFTLAYTLGLKE